jgi:NADH-quinone oxidoreductase subunit C
MNEAFPDFSEKIPHDYLGFKPISGGHQIKVAPENVRELLSYLFRDSAFWCDFLVSLSGEHLILDQEIIRIHYHLSSYTKGVQVHVWTEKSILKGEKVHFQTVSDLWKTANWHERECAELFGIEFENHPDPRNLLLPGNWEGYPLRRNYEPQEKFHGIKVKFEG